MTKIKGVIFDFGFTLFYFENPSVEKYYDCFKRGLLKSIGLLKEKQIWNEKMKTEAFLQKFSKKRQGFFNNAPCFCCYPPCFFDSQECAGTRPEHFH